MRPDGGNSVAQRDTGEAGTTEESRIADSVGIVAESDLEKPAAPIEHIGGDFDIGIACVEEEETIAVLESAYTKTLKAGRQGYCTCEQMTTLEGMAANRKQGSREGERSRDGLTDEGIGRHTGNAVAQHKSGKG